VVDLRSGAARRIDAEHLPSRTAQAQGPTRVRGGWGFPDGVALDAGGDTLYFQTLSGPDVHAVPTAVLRAFVAGGLTPAQAGARARRVSRAAPVDGIARGPDGRLYAWDVAGRRLVRYRPGRDGVETLLGDSGAFFRPDGIDVARDGTVYFTDPQFRRSATADSAVRPFRVFRLTPPRR
jgi:sugar lactone lactonase YvrE